MAALPRLFVVPSALLTYRSLVKRGAGVPLLFLLEIRLVIVGCHR